MKTIIAQTSNVNLIIYKNGCLYKKTLFFSDGSSSTTTEFVEGSVALTINSALMKNERSTIDVYNRKNKIYKSK